MNGWQRFNCKKSSPFELDFEVLRVLMNAPELPELADFEREEEEEGNWWEEEEITPEEKLFDILERRCLGGSVWGENEGF